MKSLIITKNQSGGRLDKFLFKYLNNAGSSFIHKMLRKKNITLNGKKADGSEKLAVGDEIKIFFSDETFEKFTRDTETARKKDGHSIPDLSKLPSTKLNIVYEDENVLFLNKPVGMLSQKAKEDDVSINEYAITYLIESGRVNASELKTFKPSVCNRLDRNTTGLITVGASMEGVRALSLGFKERSFNKYYVCIVSGQVTKVEKITGYLSKNKKNNKVTITQTKTNEDACIETEYEPLYSSSEFSVLRVKLITGKTHQIRAHLASTGHPIIGDMKYGQSSVNDNFRIKYNVKSQLLHSYELYFHKMDGGLANLSNKTFKAEVPEIYKRIAGDIFR